MSALQVQLPQEFRGDFGDRPVRATHNLHLDDLFSDAALADLLNRFPRKHLYALTMGSDPTRTENRLALNDGVSGKELLRAVRNGKLWLNITHVDRVDAAYRALTDTLYRQLAEHAPHFDPIETHCTLLISSPHALVYYHADASASALWHLRGRKRIWIYPPNDERFIRREHLEDIFAGVRHEYLPYEAQYDESAICYELEPGDWATWPQNAPHRVTNLDSLNVSLSTEHFTAQGRAKARVYTANRFFRRRLGVQNLAAREDGVLAAAKVFAHRAARKLGLDRIEFARHAPELFVDADAPDGCAPLASKYRTALLSI